jgi:hypothetical protein
MSIARERSDNFPSPAACQRAGFVGFEDIDSLAPRLFSDVIDECAETPKELSFAEPERLRESACREEIPDMPLG